MIKKLKHFFCKLFNIKACKCDEVDEHIEFYTKVPEPDVPVYNEPVQTGLKAKKQQLKEK
tara:strand:+ start:67 stop:246 length:180 start_codon:yes stop_codon:yes gene_type:complete